jgi:hypothetical protein
MQRAHFAKLQLATRRRITPDKVAKVAALIAAAVHYSQHCDCSTRNTRNSGIRNK